MNFYGTEKSDDHTVSGRVIPLFEALYRAIMQAGGRPVPDARYGIQLPTWCHKVCDQFTKTVFKHLVLTAPQPDKCDARNYGRLLGVALRGAAFVYRDAPSLLKKEGLLNLSPEREQKLKQFAGIP